MLGMSRYAYDRSRAHPGRAMLNRDNLERLSLVIGIYRALHTLFQDDEQADTWIDRPSTDFGGEPARVRMTNGLLPDLVYVRQYLHAAQDCWAASDS
jgi:hypothetical protein